MAEIAGRDTIEAKGTTAVEIAAATEAGIVDAEDADGGDGGAEEAAEAVIAGIRAAAAICRPRICASPQGERDSRGYDNRRPSGDRGPGPSAPVEPREDDIVLPGESLAKYRGRPQLEPVKPVVEQEPEERQPITSSRWRVPAFGAQPTTGGPRRSMEACRTGGGR